MTVSGAKRLKALEDENARLKKLLAEQMLDGAAIKELLAKNGGARDRQLSQQIGVDWCCGCFLLVLGPLNMA